MRMFFPSLPPRPKPNPKSNGTESASRWALLLVLVGGAAAVFPLVRRGEGEFGLIWQAFERARALLL